VATIPPGKAARRQALIDPAQPPNGAFPADSADFAPLGPGIAGTSNGPPDAMLQRNALEVRERENPVGRFAGHAVSLSPGSARTAGRAPTLARRSPRFATMDPMESGREVRLNRGCESVAPWP